MVEYPVEQCGGKDRIPHHLSPIRYLFVGGKDNGGGLIGIAYKCEEAVGLAPGNRGIAYFILWEVKCYGK